MNKRKAKSQHGSKCPYWALGNSKECGMVKGGMYIPMPEHIRMFCFSSLYPRCRKYLKGCELMINHDACENNEFEVSGDRRKLRRFADQLYLNLVICDTSAEPHEINTCKAKTLDVSVGGLRIESSMELNADTVVCFELDPDFSSDGLLGVGEVKWCETKKESNVFELGIAFADYSTSERMREHLGLL